jgi:hypothetical protein
MMYPPEPLRQVMQCPPGQVPPPQSLASLYTPGMGQAWHAGYVPRGMQGPPGSGHFPPPPHMQQQYHQQQQQFHHQQQPFNGRGGQGVNGRGGNQGGRAVGQGQRGGGRGGRGQQQPQQGGGRGAQYKPQQSKASDSPATGGDVAAQARNLDQPRDIAPGLSAPTNPQHQRHHVPPHGQGQFHPSHQQQQYQQQQQQQMPRRPFASSLPCGEMMTHSDVRFVVSKVLQLTETQDPYNDDFYFIQVCLMRMML